jgi:uncharacterized membrane protein YagU involved in acid resistance
MKTRFSLTSALIAGFLGTVAMTAFTYMAPLMGFKMNIPGMLAHTMHAPIIVGWLAHFMVGELLAIGYALFYLTIFRQTVSAKSGAIYGILPWLLAQLVVMPLMMVMNGMPYSAGLFSGSFLMAMASFVGHLIYGAIVGATYKPALVVAEATA